MHRRDLWRARVYLILCRGHYNDIKMCASVTIACTRRAADAVAAWLGPTAERGLCKCNVSLFKTCCGLLRVFTLMSNFFSHIALQDGIIGGAASSQLT